MGDCDNVQENCAPTDAEVFGNKDDICIPCKMLRELLDNGTFRADANFGYSRIGRNFPAVNSQEALNQLDNHTFYATLFPNLNEAQLSMFYSGQYAIELKHEANQEKFFILFGEKCQNIEQIESGPVFVVPFTFNFN